MAAKRRGFFQGGFWKMDLCLFLVASMLPKSCITTRETKKTHCPPLLAFIWSAAESPAYYTRRGARRRRRRRRERFSSKHKRQFKNPHPFDSPLVEGEPEQAGWNSPFALHVDEEEKMGEEGLQNSQEEVRLAKQFPVDQVIAAHSPGRTLKQVRLPFLVH